MVLLGEGGDLLLLRRQILLKLGDLLLVAHGVDSVLLQLERNLFDNLLFVGQFFLQFRNLLFSVLDLLGERNFLLGLLRGFLA